MSEELEIASTWAHLHSRSLVQCSPECVETLETLGVNLKGSRDSFNSCPKAAMRGFILHRICGVSVTGRSYGAQAS